MNTPTAPPPSFEDSLRELEATVERLEAGDLPLEESLALFEKGVGSLKRCHAILDQAEKRIRVLVQGVDGAIDLRDAGRLEAGASEAGASETRPMPRKKSGKQMVDAEPSARHNAAPLKKMDSKTGQRLPEEEFPQPDERGPGGSLFGVSQ